MRYGISPKELQELIEYDPGLGVFTWGIGPEVHAKVRGKSAGSLKQHSINPNRYDLVIQVGKTKIPAQNIAWALYYGVWPSNILDHIDGNPLNYAISNLRESDSVLNAHNRKTYSNNELGMKNIRLKNGKYQVRKSYKGKTYCKSWATLEEARVDRDRIVFELLKDKSYLRNTDGEQ